jgi:GNAT superfamily N-acetyltransferase
MSTQKIFNPAFLDKDMNSKLLVNVNQRKLNLIDLDRINEIIKAAVYTWQLPERVKRISLPLYYYQESDLTYMHFLIAELESFGIVGLAALEETDAVELPDAKRALLFHGLYVDPVYHRQGIASQLVDAAELAAVKAGMNGLLVKAQIDAVPFFNKQEFTKLPIEDASRDYVYRYWKAI